MIRRWAPRLVVALPWLMMAAIIWYVWPRSAPDLGPSNTIVAPYPVVVERGFRALAVAWCLTLVFLLHRLVARRSRAQAIAAAVTLVLVPFGGFVGTVVSGLAGWRDVSHLRVLGGGTYHVQCQWESDALTEETGGGPLFLRTKLIGVNPNERGYRAIVRPSGLKQFDLAAATSPGCPDAGRLAQSRDGRWLICLCAWQGSPKPKMGCATSLVYDLKLKTFYGDGTLADISPFLLIGPDDRLNGKDLEALLYTRGSVGQEYIRGDTEVPVLCRECTNPNREVRTAAAKMLTQIDLWNDRDVALARRTLGRMSGDDSSPGVRQAASEALTDLTRLVAGRAG